MYEPSTRLVAQGAKRVSLDEDAYVRDPHHSLITAGHLPTVVQALKPSLPSFMVDWNQ
jgi:hypothetical protein